MGNQDQEFVRRCAEGDGEAWSAFIERFTPLVRAVSLRIRRRLGLPAGEQAVETCAAEFFGDLCLRRGATLARFRGDGALRAFVAVLAANWVRRRIQSEVRGAASILPLHRSPAAAIAAPSAESQERFDFLLDALAACEASERLLFQLLWVDETPASDAAAILGITREALYVRKHRLVQKLQGLIAERSRAAQDSP